MSHMPSMDLSATGFENIDKEIEERLQQPPAPEIGAWLEDTVKNSGHMSTGEAMRWRLLCMIWLAAEYDLEQGWPYLMWLNMNEETMSDHLTEILTEALDDYKAYLRFAQWQSQADDEKLQTFLGSFSSIPVPYKMGPLVRHLLTQDNTPELAAWLKNYLQKTADHASKYVRPWHLLTAVWYATCFDQAEGLTYLKRLSEGNNQLSSVDNRILTELAQELNCTPAIIQWIAACPDPAIKTMLAEFGHPDLEAIVEAQLQEAPDYSHLPATASQAQADAAQFKRNLALLQQAGLSPETASVLDLACGPLAAQAILFNSHGYQTTAAGLEIPPGSLPLSGIKQRLKRGKYVKAWEAATQAYYNVLAQEAGVTLNRKKLKIALADLTRLDFADNQFDAIVCANHLQHEPDVVSLLQEVQRVLKPGGLFLANIIPYAAFSGGSPEPESTADWEHLRQAAYVPPASLIFNKWREGQYRAAITERFSIIDWQTEQDEVATARLTIDIQAELTGYEPEELTRKALVVLARKA